MRTEKAILIFSSEFPPYLGGAGTYARNLAVGLSRIGYDVRVLTIDRPNVRARQKRVDQRLFLDEGIKVARITYVPKLYLFLMAKALRRLISAGTYSALLVADSGALKACAFFLKPPDIPAWAVFHGSEAESYFGATSMMFRVARGPSRMRKYLLRLSGRIAVSDWLRLEMVRKLPELRDKCSVVHHGVEVDEKVLAIDRADARAELGVRHDMHVIFSASRLVPGKGQDVVIRALSRAVRRLPNITLLVAGDGPERGQLEELAVSDGVANHVIFVGHLDQEKMRVCYRACDLFVQPSRTDSFGLVYLEANACRRVVIAGDVAGIPESVEEGVSGFRIDPLDVDRLSTLIVELLENSKFRHELEQSAFERVSNEFRLERMAHKTVDLIFPGD